MCIMAWHQLVSPGYVIPRHVCFLNPRLRASSFFLFFFLLFLIPGTSAEQPECPWPAA